MRGREGGGEEREREREGERRRRGRGGGEGERRRRRGREEKKERERGGGGEGERRRRRGRERGGGEGERRRRGRGKGVERWMIFVARQQGFIQREVLWDFPQPESPKIPNIIIMRYSYQTYIATLILQDTRIQILNMSTVKYDSLKMYSMLSKSIAIRMTSS